MFATQLHPMFATQLHPMFAPELHPMFALQDKYGPNIFDLPKPTFIQRLLRCLRGDEGCVKLSYVKGQDPSWVDHGYRVTNWLGWLRLVA